MSQLFGMDFSALVKQRVEKVSENCYNRGKGWIFMSYVNCNLCPRRCGIDRTAGQTGYCRCPDTAMVAKRVITNERVVLYNIYENVIFYQEETGDHSVKRIYLDGTNPVMIMPGDVSNIGCTSKYTFFKKLDEDSLYVTGTFTGQGVEKLIIE